MQKPARSKGAFTLEMYRLTAEGLDEDRRLTTCGLPQMNGGLMNEQYLWDKTTEPDDETKELESLLSEFRYQPRPLILPVVVPKKVFVFDYRIAAIAAMAFIAFGFLFWLSFRYNGTTQIVDQQQPSPSVAETAPIRIENNLVGDVPKAPDQPQRIFVRRKPNILRPVQISHQRKGTSMATQERMAKDKLMYALQLTSDKLDFLQHKISVDSN